MKSLISAPPSGLVEGDFIGLNIQLPLAHDVYGRICPGRHLATASIWIAVATIFATVDITKAKDENGNEITPEVDFETGITRSVNPACP